MTILATAQPHAQSTAVETMARATFQALLAALSNPGRIFTLPGTAPSTQESCHQIGQTLLDLETSFFTSDRILRRNFEQSGARFLIASSASYLFFSDSEAFESMARQTIDIIAHANVGTMADPDQGATVIVPCRFDQGQTLRLCGPGIQHTIQIRVEGLPVEFWQLRAAKINYPLGIDLFLVDGSQVVGLPRTTKVEIE